MKEKESVFQANHATNPQHNGADAPTSRQESDIGVSHPCGQSFATSADFLEREEECGMQSHCNGLDDNEAPTIREAIVKRLREIGIDVSDPDEIQVGHADNPGSQGRSVEEMGLRDSSDISDEIARADIVNSIHKGFLQAISDLESDPTCRHRLYGACTHVQTDTPTDTNNRLLQ